MISVDRIKILRKEAKVKINKILMQLENDTGLKIIEARHRFFTERKIGKKFDIEIRFESI